MRQKLSQFMYGRNGLDLFSRFLFYAALVFLILNLIIGGSFGRVLLYIALALLVYSYFRMFSKNLDKRRAENAKYYALRAKGVNGFHDWRERRRLSRDYRFFRCPACRAMLRVPKGKGRIRVTCRKCGNAFERKT